MSAGSSQNDVVIVFGACGHQGSSVVESVLSHTDYKIRCVTRHKESKEARDLQSKSDRIELCVADENDDNSLKQAFQGVTKAFLMTDYWKPENQGRETEQGKRMGDIAKEAGVKLVVFSTLPNVRKESNGKWDVPHMTDKAEADAYLRSLNFEYYIGFGPACYYQNFIENGIMQPVDGTTFTLPDLGDRKLSMFDVNQTGEIVVHLFKNPDKYNGKYLTCIGDELTPQEIVDCFREIHGINYKLNLVSVEQYPNKELGQMFGWVRDYGYFGKADRKPGEQACGDKLNKFKEFLQLESPPKKQYLGIQTEGTDIKA